MQENEIKRVLKDGAGSLGVDLGTEALDRFVKYLRELKLWNRKINLTSISSDEEIVTRHFLDSLAPYGLIHSLDCKRVIDIGSGAGFPSIPLKIADPRLSVVLVDSVEKKVLFMRHVIRTLGLSSQGDGIRAVSARADDPKTIKELGNGFDCVISRAFSSIEDFLDIGAPYCRAGGCLVAMKGPAALKEIEAFCQGSLGGRAPVSEGIEGPHIMDVSVPGDGRVTKLVWFRKTGGV